MTSPTRPPCVRSCRSRVARALGVLATILVCHGSAVVVAAPLTPNHLLVTTDTRMFEYTRDGTRVQTINVPNPTSDRYEAVGVVMDDQGRVHIANIAPFDPSYVSTYDDEAESWIHHEDNLFLGNITDGDLSIAAGYIYSKASRLRLTDIAREDVVVDLFNGPGELSGGRDGKLYGLQSGSPRAEVGIFDPVTLEKLDQLQLLHEGGGRIDARGIEVTEEGEMYIADWAGRVSHYSPTGELLKILDMGIGSLTDIALADDGTIAVGSRFGSVGLTDKTLENVTTFEASGAFTYVAWVRAAAPVFQRGDANGDFKVDIADAIRVADVAVLGQGEIGCDDAGDSNDDGELDVSDALRILMWLFDGGVAIPAPVPGACGPDATGDELDCAAENCAA